MITKSTRFDFKLRDEFRDGLINGRPETVYPILNWLLQRQEDLKKRAMIKGKYKTLLCLSVMPTVGSELC